MLRRKHVVVSRNRGPEYRPHKIVVIIMGPQKRTPDFGKPLCACLRWSAHGFARLNGRLCSSYVPGPSLYALNEWRV